MKVTRVALREVVKARGGGTPRKSIASFYGGGIPWVTPKDMKRPLIGESEVTLTDAGVQNSPAKLVPEGSVLVVVRSGVLKHTLPVALTCRPVTVNQDMKALTPGAELDPSYLARMLKALQPTVLSWVRATTADNFPIDSLLDLEVDLPPLAEQRRIAAILDHADALRAQRRQVRTHVDALAQSIFHDMFGSANCASVSLGTLVDFHSGGTPSKSRKEYWEGDLPWFSAKDLKAPDLWDSQDHIAGKVTRETNLRLLPRDTITMVVRGMILAHTIPVSTLRVPATINQDLKALIPKSSVDVDFLSEAIRARSGWILGRVSTAAHGTKKLDSNVLDSIPVPNAESRLQALFAERLAQVNLERETVARALAADSELFASLQSRAFRGEL